MSAKVVGRVIFSPLGLQADVLEDETLLDAARRAGAPIGNSCGAVGVCARCRVRLIEGSENVGGVTPVEARISMERGFATGERLACQAVVRGDCTVTTGYWGS